MFSSKCSLAEHKEFADSGNEGLSPQRDTDVCVKKENLILTYFSQNGRKVLTQAKLQVLSL